MEKQRQIKILSIVALVLAISAMTLGFAAFSTTLTISSSASVNPDSSTFAVKFSLYRDSYGIGDVETVTSGIETTKGIITNGKEPTLSNLSATFTSPGQYAMYPLFIRNEGEYTAYLNNVNYIGKKTCVAEPGTSEKLVQQACEYITITVGIGTEKYTETSQITNHPLASLTGEQFYVSINYDEAGPSVDGSFKITFPSISLVYSTVDNSSMNGKVVRVVSGDINTIGSVVAIGNEQFYVIGKENEKVKLLSMYNLHVGNRVDFDENEYPIITPLSNPTGIQDSEARGFVEVGHSSIGTTAFSNTGSTYSGSIVEGYVNNYKTYLTSMGADISAARLITKAELENLGCSGSDYSCTSAPSWVYLTSYWSETVNDNDNSCVWDVISSGGLVDYDGYSNDMDIGVRPVIEIPISEFE